MSHPVNGALIDDFRDFLAEYEDQVEYDRAEIMFWNAVDKEMRGDE